MSERKTEVLTDALGRKITARDLSTLEQMRLLKACGPMNSQNQPYYYMAECAAMATDIDGIPLPKITTERSIEVAVEKLGDEGMAALMMFRVKQIRELEERARAAMESGEAAPDPTKPSV